MGAFVAAAEAGVPVVPIAIRGTRAIVAPGSSRPRRGTVQVSVGPRLRAEGATFGDALRLRDRARRWIAERSGEREIDEGDALLHGAPQTSAG
jgi:1-acyl-sn-glycerol-3-phosphate acyltransferase